MPPARCRVARLFGGQGPSGHEVMWDEALNWCNGQVAKLWQMGAGGEMVARGEIAKSEGACCLTTATILTGTGCVASGRGTVIRGGVLASGVVVAVEFTRTPPGMAVLRSAALVVMLLIASSSLMHSAKSASVRGWWMLALVGAGAIVATGAAGVHCGAGTVVAGRGA